MHPSEKLTKMGYHEFVLPSHITLTNPYLRSVLHLNACSASSKHEEISDFISQFSFRFSTILLTETWYSDGCNMLNLPNYNNFFLNRPQQRGGGVAIYVERGRTYDLVPDFCKVTEDYEILTLRYSTEFITVVYRPPRGNVQIFFSFLESYLDYMSVNNFNIICGGDLNINILENTSDTANFKRILSSTGFTNLISTPTRVTLTTASCLDLLITNVEPTVLHAGTLASGISDHCPVFAAFNNSVSKKKRQSEPVSLQHLSAAALQSFKHEISKCDWSHVTLTTDVNEAYSSFLETFLHVYNKHFPFKTLKQSKKSRKPWVTRAHLEMIKNKNKLYHMFLRTRCPTQLKEFKIMRNKLNSELRRAKVSYYHSIFSDITKKRPDAVWKVINNVLGRDKKHATPESIAINGHHVSGPNLAEHFNTYFANAGMPDCNRIPCNMSHTQFLEYSISDSLFLAPTDEAEIFRTFMNLNNSRALDVNNVQTKPVKYVIGCVASVLKHIFNLALVSASFPEEMKKARVSVIHKGGDKHIMKNYRPISVLPVFSKALEKIICTRLTRFFSSKHILADAQFGFRKGRSTETALLTLKEYIVRNIDNRAYTLGLFIDFSKAFDSLSHEILGDKLYACGVRGKPLELLKSYLNNRQQYVCLQGSQSSFLPISRGVPQGSILGPLLFNLYINDLVNIDKSAKFIIYADDSTILFSGLNVNELVLKCNNTLLKLSSWSSLNEIKINPLKTKVIIFHARGKSVELSSPILYEGQNIPLVNEHKILGVTFSAHLSWNSHIEELCKKLSSTTGALSRCQRLLPSKVKLQVYYALFASHLNYCSLVWTTTTKNNLNKIFLLQKKILRHIANIPYLASTKTVFQEYNIVRVQHLYKFRVLQSFHFSYTYKQFLVAISELTSNNSTVRTRHTLTWFVPRFRTTYSSQALHFTLPSILNESGELNNATHRQLRVLFASML